jgi:hypothetical protein
MITVAVAFARVAARNDGAVLQVVAKESDRQATTADDLVSLMRSHRLASLAAGALAAASVALADEALEE